MRLVIFLTALVMLASPAWANSYLLICSPSSCRAPDRTVQPAGTAINRITWDGSAALSAPPGTQIIPDDGRAIYRPHRLATQISALGFINRFTPGEQQAVQTAAQTHWNIQLWMTEVSAAGTIDVTNYTVTQGMAALVAANLITAARSAQILDLSHPSP